MVSTKPLEINIKDRISPNAKVWIYQSSSPFNAADTEKLSSITSDFVKDWAAHGTGLIADSQIFFNRFICLFVDESAQGASGCSIDSSVHFIQNLEKQFGISLMNRTDVAYVDAQGDIKLIDLYQLKDAATKGEISDKTFVFNNLVRTKEEMENLWLTPISESWHKRMLS